MLTLGGTCVICGVPRAAPVLPVLSELFWIPGTFLFPDQSLSH